MIMSAASFRLKQALRRLAWTNRATLAAATAAVDLSYLARRALRAKPAPAAAPAAGGGSDEGATLRRYRTEFAGIKGNFNEEAAVAWDVLLARQKSMGRTGNLMEIGVLKGLSATLLALHAQPGERLVLVDPALRREAIDAVSAIRTENNVLLRAKSQEIHGRPEIEGLDGTFRWIHIDGEHSGGAVTNDLGIAERLLAPDGIICLDDFFGPAYPQITAAAFSWLAATGGALRLFLVGFNKGFVCRAEAAPALLAFLRDHLVEAFDRRGYTEINVCKTNEPDDLNCFGILPRMDPVRLKGPDWSPDRIPI